MSGFARKHYDMRARETSAERRRSAVLPLRKANNAVKSALLEQALREAMTNCTGDTVHVLDLGCGRGGDLPKWGALSESLNISIRYYGIDVSEASLNELRKRASVLTKRWPNLCVNVVAGDFCNPASLPSDWPLADIVSAQFSLHYAFASLRNARSLFELIGAATRPTALLVGTLVDSRQLKQKWSSNLLFEEDATSDRVFAVTENAHYKAKIDLDNLKRLVGASAEAKVGRQTVCETMCGVAYNFTLDRCVDDCQEYLVEQGVFTELAKKALFEKAIWHNFPAYNCHKMLPYEQAVVHSLYCTFYLRKAQREGL